MSVEAYWNAYLQALPPGAMRPKGYFEAFRFGNTEKMANELAKLILQRVKTATSALLWDYELKGKKVQQVGDFSIVINWDGDPQCIIQTVELQILAFKDVDVRFAYDYGEGDRTLAWWRTHLWGYYVEECASLGRQATPAMPLVCERFRVVYQPRLPSLAACRDAANSLLSE